jgi:hypothetical protein
MPLVSEPVYSYDRTIASNDGMSAEAFITQLEAMLRLREKTGFGARPNQPYPKLMVVKFVNLKPPYQKAEAEANLFTFFIRGFDESDPKVPTEQVRIEAERPPPGFKLLRAKTAKPEVIAGYLADYLNGVVSATRESYDRTRTAGAYDKHLSKAKSDAKGHWGSGWSNLTPEMQQAYVCYYLVGELAGVDYEAAFKAETETEKKLLSRLVDIGEVCSQAIL